MPFNCSHSTFNFFEKSIFQSCCLFFCAGVDLWLLKFKLIFTCSLPTGVALSQFANQFHLFFLLLCLDLNDFIPETPLVFPPKDLADLTADVLLRLFFIELRGLLLNLLPPLLLPLFSPDLICVLFPPCLF